MEQLPWCIMPDCLDNAKIGLTWKRSGHASSEPILQRPDEKTHFAPHTHTHAHACIEGRLDQRAAVLFGRLMRDPFRTAHRGVSCNAWSALLEKKEVRKKICHKKDWLKNKKKLKVN